MLDLSCSLSVLEENLLYPWCRARFQGPDKSVIVDILSRSFSPPSKRSNFVIRLSFGFHLWKLCTTKIETLCVYLVPRLLLLTMEIHSPQLEKYFINRCLATVQNEKLRRTGTPPIPNPIIILFAPFPHFIPVSLLSLLHSASEPV